jgi:hypothetical protein
MITKETAAKFVNGWLNAFNLHNMESILEHYANEIEFYSPFISLLKFNDESIIKNKTDLK